MIDLASNRVRDYLGEPYLISADLLFHVTKDGSLINESGPQHAVLGKEKILLPSLLSASGHAIDGYNHDKGVYTIAVTTYNPLPEGELQIIMGSSRKQKIFNSLT